MSYNELAKKRPTKTEVIKEIAYIGGNDKVEIKDVIHELYVADKMNRYTNKWVSIEDHTDEWGHSNGYTLVVMGEREYTDKEWKDEINLSILRMKNEKERIESRMNYFTQDYEGSYSDTVKALQNKLKEFKEK